MDFTCCDMMGMPWLGWLVMILFLLLVVWLFVQLINQLGSQRPEKESSLEILDRQYASGELTTKEYEERKRKLQE